MASQLELRCKHINLLFEDLMKTNSRVEKEIIVARFRAKWPQLCKDLDYCFEVLAGKHKLGYTYTIFYSEYDGGPFDNCKIREFIEHLKTLPPTGDSVLYGSRLTPPSCRAFIANLVNREFKLGYSNKEAMITNYSPMLAKKYQDTFREQYYYVQEKLDGNRCIAYYDYEEGKYRFMSRSGKELKVNFDMSWVDKWVDYCLDHQFIIDLTNGKGGIEYPTFDGEIMTLEHAGTRDFNRTSGAINGKYTDKSGLHYFIYDIIADKMTYEQRKSLLDTIIDTGADCQILPVLDKVYVYPNHDYNGELDKWLDFIVDKGGEGVMLRDPNGYYQCGKRSDGLLKYKKTQTMDLRIVGWNEGNGKYEGAVGSFQCETDDGDIKVNVSGMPDNLHYHPHPDSLIGSIVEVAYFDVSISSATGQKSLRFPRLKCFRNDKDTTSIY